MSLLASIFVVLVVYTFDYVVFIVLYCPLAIPDGFALIPLLPDLRSHSPLVSLGSPLLQLQLIAHAVWLRSSNSAMQRMSINLTRHLALLTYGAHTDTQIHTDNSIS